MADVPALPVDEQLRVALTEGLRVHPRLTQQQVGGDGEALLRLLAALPRVVPFRPSPPVRVCAVLDWDHRLPSQHAQLRILLHYDEAAAARFDDAFARRAALIDARNLFPEFDLPDFDELPADEAYEVELSATLGFESMRLTSGWRREIDAQLAARAVARVRASDDFATVKAAQPARPAQLGDLEPVSWLPPCESGQPQWTIDVWWLTAFDGKTGTGWSFLVDPEAAAVVAHREFSVRAG